MSRGFVNKIIKNVFKILKNIKIVRKQKEMGQDNNGKQKQVTIGANTVVHFTVKGFIATIMSILGIFASFYFLIVVPKINDAQKFQEKLYERVEDKMTDGFKEVNTGVRNNGSGIKDLTGRFDDLNRLNESLGNTGGSFSSTADVVVTESVVPDTLITDTALANNGGN